MRLTTLLFCLFSSSVLLKAQSIILTPGGQSLNKESIANQMSLKGNGLTLESEVSIEGNPNSNITTTPCTAPVYPLEELQEAGIITDPSGMFASYQGSLYNYDCGKDVSNYSQDAVGYEIIFAEFDLGYGDTLHFGITGINESSYHSGNLPPDTVYIHSPRFNIHFTTNGDAFTGSGYSIRFRTVYQRNQNSPNLPKAGNALVYNSNKGSLVMGDHETEYLENIGNNSASLGFENQVPSDFSFALGQLNEIESFNSIAMGKNNLISGLGAIAIGQSNTLKGETSYSLGDYNHVSGTSALSLGNDNRLYGDKSMSLGNLNTNTSDESLTLGYGLIEKNLERAVVTGMFNDTTGMKAANSVQDKIFMIGNGQDDFNRSNAFIIRRNGQTGINTPEPQAGLHITRVPFTNQWDNHIRLEDNPIDFGNILYNSNGMLFRTQGPGDDYYFYNDSGVNTMLLDDTGNMTISGTHYNTSDRRLKRNFSVLDNSLTGLQKLNGYHYIWKDSSKDQRIQTGLIAQEVQDIFPELVNENKDGYLSVNYQGLIPHLLEAVKELSMANQELLKKVQKLENSQNGSAFARE